MRKRSKKRIPQDVKPWVGLKTHDQDILAMPGKKTSRWVAGGRRDWNTRILNTAGVLEVKKLILKALARSLSTEASHFASLAAQKLSQNSYAITKTASIAKYKNFCLISGRGRTYNRSLYMARHNLRKFVGAGAISGLNK